MVDLLVFGGKQIWPPAILGHYQTKCDANFPDVFLIERCERDGEGHRGRHEDAEADAEKEAPVAGLHGREVDGEDGRDEEQVDQPELEPPRGPGHGGHPVLLLQNDGIKPRVPPAAKRSVECLGPDCLEATS